jgi:hypothetical protein
MGMAWEEARTVPTSPTVIVIGMTMSARRSTIGSARQSWAKPARSTTTLSPIYFFNALSCQILGLGILHLAVSTFLGFPSRSFKEVCLLI